jgi:pimeloyl-ACP methyl ester carboxylesterase
MSLLPSMAVALGCLLLSAGRSAGRAQQGSARERPVEVVAPNRIDVPTTGKAARLAAYISADWSAPHPEVTRAVLVFHGILRNADVYYAGAVEARAAAGAKAAASTLLIAPQFLADLDADAHSLSADTLVWTREGWPAGADAVAPAPVSSFAAIDAILARLADKALFPNLTTVVVAGHSGGGQVVQRYAVVGQGNSVLARRGVHVRYVVANPSSYVYFTSERPGAGGRMMPFAGAADCPRYNDWKYGFADGMPGYISRPMASYTAQYAARDVVYLLGTKDIDPDHPALDKSCMGEAQGPYRYARGHWYFAQLKSQLGSRLLHHLHDVPGVGHNGTQMFTSACGLSALFDKAGCGQD